jgi:hypothetical protein
VLLRGLRRDRDHRVPDLALRKTVILSSFHFVDTVYCGVGNLYVVKGCWRRSRRKKGQRDFL